MNQTIHTLPTFKKLMLIMYTYEYWCGHETFEGKINFEWELTFAPQKSKFHKSEWM